eukprot:3552808-Pleurochrysis_carterae.AAC.1
MSSLSSSTSDSPPTSRSTAVVAGSNARIESASARSFLKDNVVPPLCDMRRRLPPCRRWSCACPGGGCRASR